MASFDFHAKNPAKTHQYLHLALNDACSYILNIYDNGGYYDSDQDIHQYVFEQATNDRHPKLYFVYLDYRFLKKYDNVNRDRPTNALFFRSVVSIIGYLIYYVENCLSLGHLPTARSIYHNLLQNLILADQHLDLIQEIQMDFNNDFK